MDSFVHNAPVWALSSGLFVAMLASWQLGVWLRRRAFRSDAGDSDDGVGHILSGVLGLLALLVGFTFSLALDRHETRRALVVAEANALGTTYLRTSLFEDAAPLRDLLRRYTAQRLAYGLEAGPPQAKAAAEADRLRSVIWREAMELVAPVRTTELAPLLLTPLNEAIDAATSRSAALRTRLPTSVLVILAVYACVSAGVVGYAVAGVKGRHRVASAVLFGLLAIAIALILDLDRPRNGAIRIPQTAMAHTLAGMR